MYLPEGHVGNREARSGGAFIIGVEMPTYEYVCTDCGNHIDVFQNISDESLQACGICGGKLRKVFHPAGILFKGSGFYTTDNRKKQPKTESKPEKKAPDKKSEKKSESKPKKDKPKEKSA